MIISDHFRGLAKVLVKVSLTRVTSFDFREGGSVLQKLNHIYSFLYYDFHLLIDREFLHVYYSKFLYSVYFIFFLLMVIHRLTCSLLLQNC